VAEEGDAVEAGGDIINIEGKLEQAEAADEGDNVEAVEAEQEFEPSSWAEEQRGKDLYRCETLEGKYEGTLLQWPVQELVSTEILQGQGQRPDTGLQSTRDFAKGECIGFCTGIIVVGKSEKAMVSNDDLKYLRLVEQELVRNFFVPALGIDKETQYDIWIYPMRQQANTRNILTNLKKSDNHNLLSMFLAEWCTQEVPPGNEFITSSEENVRVESEVQLRAAISFLFEEIQAFSSKLKQVVDECVTATANSSFNHVREVLEIETWTAGMENVLPADTITSLFAEVEKDWFVEVLRANTFHQLKIPDLPDSDFDDIFASIKDPRTLMDSMIRCMYPEDKQMPVMCALPAYRDHLWEEWGEYQDLQRRLTMNTAETRGRYRQIFTKFTRLVRCLGIVGTGVEQQPLYSGFPQLSPYVQAVDKWADIMVPSAWLAPGSNSANSKATAVKALKDVWALEDDDEGTKIAIHYGVLVVMRFLSLEVLATGLQAFKSGKDATLEDVKPYVGCFIAGNSTNEVVNACAGKYLLMKDFNLPAPPSILKILQADSIQIATFESKLIAMGALSNVALQAHVVTKACMEFNSAAAASYVQTRRESCTVAELFSERVRTTTLSVMQHFKRLQENCTEVVLQCAKEQSEAPAERAVVDGNFLQETVWVMRRFQDTSSDLVFSHPGGELPVQLFRTADFASTWGPATMPKAGQRTSLAMPTGYTHVAPGPYTTCLTHRHRGNQPGPTARFATTSHFYCGLILLHGEKRKSCAADAG
jgi:hypothetical protein